MKHLLPLECSNCGLVEIHFVYRKKSGRKENKYIKKKEDEGINTEGQKDGQTLGALV